MLDDQDVLQRRFSLSAVMIRAIAAVKASEDQSSIAGQLLKKLWLTVNGNRVTIALPARKAPAIRPLPCCASGFSRAISKMMTKAAKPSDALITASARSEEHTSELQ